MTISDEAVEVAACSPSCDECDAIDTCPNQCHAFVAGYQAGFIAVLRDYEKNPQMRLLWAVEHAEYENPYATIARNRRTK